MAYVGMIYNPRSKHDGRPPERHPVRYLAGFYQLDELGLQLRRQAAQVGWDEAEQQIALSDGGNGLEEFFRKNFPLAECILDFWHAAEHLTELGLALYPENVWGLAGLRNALQAQGKPAQAAQVQARLDRAGASADIPITGSRL